MTSTQLGEIISRAWKDDAFRARLLADPASALEECGVEVPRDVHLYIHENSTAEMHVVIPGRPDEIDEAVEEDLTIDSGGCKLPCRGDNSW
jgi:hypothetical protein